MSLSSLVHARRWIWVALGAAVLAPRAPAQGLDSEDEDTRNPVELRIGATRSDNVLRTPGAEVDGTVWSAGLGLNVNRSSRRLNLLARGDLDWMEFPSDTFGSDLFGYFDGLARVALAPEVFVWSFQDTYGQLRADPFVALTPGNVEDINYFTTGPDLTLRPGGGATSIRVSGRYSTTDSGVAELDSDRYRGELALVRELSSASSASLNGTSERFEFDNPASGDFDRHEAFARFETRGSRTDLSLDLGYTAVDEAQESSGGVLARLYLTRRLSPAVRLRLAAGTEFSDAGDVLRGGLAEPGLEQPGLEQPDPEQTGSVLGTGDPFERRFAALGWHFARTRTGFGIDAERSEERHQNAVSLDRTRTSYGLYFVRRLTPVVTLRALVRRDEQSFENGFDDEELQASAALAWAVGRALELRLRYARLDRDSSAGTTEFTENRASLFVTWSPLAR